jgi:hypothetical protein
LRWFFHDSVSVASSAPYRELGVNAVSACRAMLQIQL